MHFCGMHYDTCTQSNSHKGFTVYVYLIYSSQVYHGSISCHSLKTFVLLLINMFQNVFQLGGTRLGERGRGDVAIRASRPGGGGRKRLPKFKFSAKFPIGLHVILQIQIKKFENDCYLL